MAVIGVIEIQGDRIDDIQPDPSMAWVYERQKDLQAFGRMLSALDERDGLTGDIRERADEICKQITDLASGVKTEERGECPKCHAAGIYRNVGKNHWWTCESCKVKWSGGSGLFSCWKDESQELWEKNAEDLMKYEKVNQDGEEVKTQSTPPETPELVAAGNADNPS